MKIRFRGPSGPGTAELGDDATVADLVAAIRSSTGLDGFELKYGWPLRTLDLARQRAEPLASLNMAREAVTIVPAERAAPAPAPARGEEEERKKSAFVPKKAEVDETSVEWADRGGHLVLRVMPDDNSCMFTAFGGAIKMDNPAPELRRNVADYIRAHPDKYDAVVLEMPPSRYIDIIQTRDRWGGAIELGILSDIYDIQICSIDVKSNRVDTYGEDKEQRCILVYSGIHYDRIAFSFGPDLPVDMDITKWATGDEEAVERARALCRKLNVMHYYTDTTSFVLKCNAPGCGWIGAGEVDAAKHMKATSHVDMEEMEIT